MLTVTVRPQKVAAVLAYCIALLAVTHLLVSTLRIYWPSMLGLHRLFSLGREANLPTYFSAIQLLVAGLLLTVIARVKHREQDRQWRGWMLLASGFLVMSVDEAAQIHEGVVGKLVARVFGQGEGILHYVWYIAYIPLLLALLVIYVPFLKSLPRRYFKLFAGAGLIFVGGAIGVEMGEAYLASKQLDGLILNISLLVEESFEMGGVALFIYALLRYIGETQLVVRLSVQPEHLARPKMPSYVKAEGEKRRLEPSNVSQQG